MWRGGCCLLHPPDPGSPAAHGIKDTVIMPDVLLTTPRKHFHSFRGDTPGE